MTQQWWLDTAYSVGGSSRVIDFLLTGSLSESLVRANAHLKETEGLVGRSVYICTYISTIIILLFLRRRRVAPYVVR